MQMTSSRACALVLSSWIALVSNGAFAQQGNQAQSAAPPPSQHVESVNFDHWVVTCQDGGAGGRMCVATLRVLGSDGKQAIANWQIGYSKDRRLVSAFQVSPSLTAKTSDNKTSTGVSTKNGAEMKLGASAPRRLVYEGCTPQLCEAITLADDAFIKDASGAATTTVTVSTLDGTSIPLTFESKGLDKAVAAVVARKIK
ncbi:MAG: invasion associated locus B family protein [Methylocystis sp.]|uniref:invasion associated locus B family protein n=1 Tax=Methylocystis sp. TaxID=1911079 RepID=UPI003DA44092